MTRRLAILAAVVTMLLGISPPPANAYIDIGVGSGARVAALPGAFGLADWATSLLGGRLCAAPNVCDPIQYYNIGDFFGEPGGMQSLNDGEQKIQDWLHNNPGKKIVMGHSQGANVIYKWLRDHSFDPDAPPPSELSFVTLAAAERKDTGYAWFDPTGMYAGRKQLGMGLPANTPYKVTDGCIKWDGYCYWVPGDERSKKGQSTLHLQYGDVDLNSPANQVTQEGNVTYVLIPPPPGWG